MEHMTTYHDLIDRSVALATTGDDGHDLLVTGTLTGITAQGVLVVNPAEIMDLDTRIPRTAAAFLVRADEVGFCLEVVDVRKVLA